jgi:hypothetical protein
MLTDAEEPSINELEFSLKHDADVLLSRSDVSVLSSSDVNLIKLVLCSGLYPNISISDSANYARKLSEQTFHTSSKKFLSMHPTSVFSYNPEAIQPVPPSNSASEIKEDTLSSLHGRVENKELLCYLQLLETTKPYLTNAFRIHGLHACLLFARTIDINHSMDHFVVDDWLHLSIPKAGEAQNCIVLGNWLQHAWKYVVEEDLKQAKIQAEMSLLPKSKTETEKTVWASSTAIPKCLRRVHREWQEIVDGRISDLDAVDVSVRLGEFLMVSVDYNIERLKTSELQDLVSIHMNSAFRAHN